MLLAGRDPAHDIELGTDRPLVCCADGEGTLIADDLSGEVRDATLADLGDVCRLHDALPEIDFLWTSLSSPSLAAGDGAARGRRRGAARVVQAPAERLAQGAAPGAAADRHARGRRRRFTRRAAHLLVPALHGGAAAARPGGHRREPRPRGRRRHDLPDVDAADGLHGAAHRGRPLGHRAWPSCSPAWCCSSWRGRAAGSSSSPCPAATDMRTGQYLGGAPEVALANLVLRGGLPLLRAAHHRQRQHQRRRRRGLTRPASRTRSSGSPSRSPGRTAWWRARSCDGSRVLSPAKVVLDADAIGMLQHVLARRGGGRRVGAARRTSPRSGRAATSSGATARAPGRAPESSSSRAPCAGPARRAASTRRSRPTPPSALARSSRRTRSFRCPTRRRGSWTRSSPRRRTACRRASAEAFGAARVPVLPRSDRWPS